MVRVGQIYDRRQVPEHNSSLAGVTSQPPKLKIVEVSGDRITGVAIGLSPLLIPRRYHFIESEIQTYFMLNVAETMEAMLRSKQNG